jgi:hypothetical protein
MALDLSDAVANAACNAIVDLLDAGSAAGYMEIRTGAPAGIANAAGGTLLSEHAFTDPAFGDAAAGVATAAAIASDTILDDGTAAHFRAYDSDDTACFEGTVSATGGGGDGTFNSVAFSAGATADIDSMTFTVVGG